MSVAGDLLNSVVVDAVAWAKEGGLFPPFHTSATIYECGYKIEVTETSEKQRSATCSYTCEGKRSMYQLDKSGG